MASSVNIPDPNADGCYSRVLGSDYEEVLIKRINETATNILVVDATNAGELLFHIWDQAKVFSALGCPLYLSTLDQCNSYIQQHPEQVSLLHLVHNKQAYAWYCESFTPITHAGSPLKHTPVMPSPGDFDQMVDSFLTKYRPTMRELVEKADHVPSFLPSWEPKSVTDENFAKHISGLCIPFVSGGRPSLLLHDLGEERSDLDKARTARIPDIFAFAYNTVLINTSGSGKTRLLLEGLCRRWGFYIVAKVDTAGIGSSDLWRVMEELDDAKDYRRAKSMKKANKEAEAATNHMQEVAERRLAQLLLARFLLLNLLVEEAKALPGGLREKEHRRLWVLLQACPHIFSGDFESDIFTDLTRLLPEASTTDLNNRIRAQCRALKGLRRKVRNPDGGKKQIPPFFCVIDEVQVTVTQRVGEFMSGDNSTERPILRQIWLLWTGLLHLSQMRLVLSGTGIEQQALKETLSSDVFKERIYQTKSDIGAFDDPAAQAEYILRYLPASWSDPCRKEFFTRAWAWLHGRFRATATLIILILEAGYQCPHRTIDEYVKAFTDFKPTDGEDWTDREPQLPPGFSIRDRVNQLNFQKMNVEQASTLRDVIYDQILYGEITLSSFTNEAREAFVEYGFARHKPGTDHTVIDEPLAILAASRWLSNSREFSMSMCLTRDINKHEDRKNGFEAYLAFYMRAVFEAAPKLDTIFTFRDDFVRRGKTDLAWQHETFELVALVQVDGNSPHVSVVTPSCGTASNVGFLAKSGEEVLEWISANSKRFTYCFPPSSFGPDLLFFVRSTVSRKLLLVICQAKKYESVEKHTLIEGVRSVTPSWFWKQRKLTHPTADIAPFINKRDAQLANDSHAALANVPDGLKVKGADYPVLRVFASWPGEAKLERTVAWKGNQRRGHVQATTQRVESSADNIEDPDLHPLATLHLANFNKTGEDFDTRWFLGDLEQKLVVHLKYPRDQQAFEQPRLRKYTKPVV